MALDESRRGSGDWRRTSRLRLGLSGRAGLSPKTKVMGSVDIARSKGVGVWSGVSWPGTAGRKAFKH